MLYEVITGATVVTSMFMKNGIAKKVHVVAGVAFCGFALWHHMLYQPAKKEKRKVNRITSYNVCYTKLLRNISSILLLISIIITIIYLNLCNY